MRSVCGAIAAGMAPHEQTQENPQAVWRPDVKTVFDIKPPAQAWVV